MFPVLLAARWGHRLIIHAVLGWNGSPSRVQQNKEKKQDPRVISSDQWYNLEHQKRLKTPSQCTAHYPFPKRVWTDTTDSIHPLQEKAGTYQWGWMHRSVKKPKREAFKLGKHMNYSLNMQNIRSVKLSSSW